MILVGLAAAALLTLPGLLPAIGVVLLIQLQLLLDCSDGELARWRKTSSVAGIFLDRLAHNVTEAALPIALAIRADGGWDSLGGWTTLGLLIAVLVLLLRVVSALVYVARAEAGLPVAEDTAAVAAPRRAGSRGRAARCPSPRSSARSSRSSSPSSRWRPRSGTRSPATSSGTRALVIVLLPVAALTLAGRLAAILTSQRLR